MGRAVCRRASSCEIFLQRAPVDFAHLVARHRGDEIDVNRNPLDRTELRIRGRFDVGLLEIPTGLNQEVDLVATALIAGSGQDAHALGAQPILQRLLDRAGRDLESEHVDDIGGAPPQRQPAIRRELAEVAR